jgi:hypothetical protein
VGGLALASVASVVAWSDEPVRGAPVVNLEARANGGGSRQTAASSDTGRSRFSRGTVEPPYVIGAAGDIACDPQNSLFNDGDGSPSHCRAADTRRLLTNIHADVVLALGDTQYEDGKAWKYRRSYALSWGHLRGRTRPAIGNHEYGASSTGKGYFSYFGARAGRAGRGWYSYNVGAWHMIALNSNCSKVGCGHGTRQHRWLKKDLALHRTSCTLAYWHHPRYSSGPHGNDPDMEPFWKVLYRRGAEVILNGHDHLYERFAPMRPSGRRDWRHGLRQFTIGTGGSGLYPVATVRPNSVARWDRSFGVLRMELRPRSYVWRFFTVGGSTFNDRGDGRCHGRP